MSQQVENVRTQCLGCGAINDVVVVLPGQVLENDMILCRDCGGELGLRRDILAVARQQAETARDQGAGPSISVKPDITEN